MTYESPRLVVHGSVEALTMGNNGTGNNSGGVGIGNDCKLRGANGYKQTGGVDLNVQSNPQNGLGSCSA